jgi:hypothetical protein
MKIRFLAFFTTQTKIKVMDFVHVVINFFLTVGQNSFGNKIPLSTSGPVGKNHDFGFSIFPLLPVSVKNDHLIQSIKLVTGSVISVAQ